MRSLIALLVILLLPIVVSAQAVTPAVPTDAQATPLPADDPRLTVCSGPTLAGFVPYIVRPGDQLADLLTGVPNISVTQLAALNCLDDPLALPIGAVIWIPDFTESESPLAPGSDAPAIRAFDVESPNFQNQDTFTLSWDASGAEVYLYACPSAADDCPRPDFAEPVPLVGERVINSYRYAGEKPYRLEAVGGGETLTEDLTFTVTCSQAWLGPISGSESCPAEPPRVVFGAWQPFEGGVMLWFSDTSEIWVLTNADHRVQVFADTYVDGEANPQVSAPGEFHTPERGFGKVWQALGGPDSGLGWALAPETGFDSARQAAGSRSYTTYLQGPGTTVYAVTVIPQLEVGLWTTVAG